MKKEQDYIQEAIIGAIDNKIEDDYKETFSDFTNKQKSKRSSELTEEDIKRLQAKKYLTTKEVEAIYNISLSSQRDYRGRKNNKLNCIQEEYGHRITYDVEELEKWLKENNKWQ